MDNNKRIKRLFFAINEYIEQNKLHTTSYNFLLINFLLQSTK